MCLWTLQCSGQTDRVKNTLRQLLCFQLQTKRTRFTLPVSGVWNEPCLTTTPPGSAFEEGLGPLPGNARAAGKGHDTPFLRGKSRSFLLNRCKGEQSYCSSSSTSCRIGCANADISPYNNKSAPLHQPLFKRKALWAVGIVWVYKISSRDSLSQLTAPKHHHV